MDLEWVSARLNPIIGEHAPKDIQNKRPYQLGIAGIHGRLQAPWDQLLVLPPHSKKANHQVNLEVKIPIAPRKATRIHSF